MWEELIGGGAPGSDSFKPEPEEPTASRAPSQGDDGDWMPRPLRWATSGATLGASIGTALRAPEGVSRGMSQLGFDVGMGAGRAVSAVTDLFGGRY
jgi:hypothetical protein